MPRILLATFNARYLHTAFALRYLQANLAELEASSQILEFSLEERPLDCLQKILDLQPEIVGFSVYIWNTQATLSLIRALRLVRPDVKIVLGGPEVSYEWEDQELFRLCDYLVRHEGEVAFRQLCRELLSGKIPTSKVIEGGQPTLNSIVLPYRLYSDRDIRERVIYVEASRGCPFSCEFCLSSLDRSTRYFDLDTLLDELQQLLERGARQFKFIDRTFNLRPEFSHALLSFFLDRHHPDLFLHFEMVPDRFPEALRQLVRRFPPGCLQFEIGIQTFHPEVQKRIRRRQDLEKVAENFRFLRQETGVHIHADLIAGLPGESLEDFGAGFDRLLSLRPQEIQVGILKRLRGTPILRHDQTHQMIYHTEPPYEVLQTDALSFAQLMELKRFSRLWDVVANRGRFPRCLRLLLRNRPFANFLDFTGWSRQQIPSTHELGMPKIARLLFDFLTVRTSLPLLEVAQQLIADYTEDKGRDLPPFLRDYPEIPEEWLRRPKTKRNGPYPNSPKANLPKRQARHLT